MKLDIVQWSTNMILWYEVNNEATKNGLDLRHPRHSSTYVIGLGWKIMKMLNHLHFHKIGPAIGMLKSPHLLESIMFPNAPRTITLNSPWDLIYLGHVLPIVSNQVVLANPKLDSMWVIDMHCPTALLAQLLVHGSLMNNQQSHLKTSPFSLQFWT